MIFFVYAIRSDSGRIYIGQTDDIVRRLALHNAGVVPSTKKCRPWNLVKAELFHTREEARYFEWSLKRSRGKRQKWLLTK